MSETSITNLPLLPLRMIRIEEVSTTTGLSVRNIYAQIGAGNFPQALKLEAWSSSRAVAVGRDRRLDRSAAAGERAGDAARGELTNGLSSLLIKMTIEPRWLDTRAADYISVRPDALARLVKAGRIPAPTYPLGPRNPRWDRLALDSHFEGGAASTDIDQLGVWSRRVVTLL